MSPRGRSRAATVSAVRRPEDASSRHNRHHLQDTGAGFLRRLWSWVHDGPLVHSYYALAVSAILLSAVGTMMVLSSSAVESIAANRSAFYYFQRQAFFAVAGVAAMFAVSLVPSRVYRKLAWWGYGITTFGVLAVVFIGEEINGNRNWIALGGFSFQPSEFAKLGVALMLGWYFGKYGSTLHGPWAYLWPSVAIVLAPIVFVGLGGDAGTAIIFVMIYAAALFFSGAPWKLFGVTGTVVAAISALVVIMAPHRMQRVTSWITGNCDPSGSCWQAQQGLGALATGGWWGVGLGQSRSKYNYVPEAHNDYIFAIIGEELGLFGTVFILALFAVMAVAMARVLLRSTSTFERITTGGVLAWLIGQAFVNIGMVTGALPVIGVPLPFISYGGSSLFTCLVAVGVVMSFTRITQQRSTDLDLDLDMDPDRGTYVGPGQRTDARAEAGAEASRITGDDFPHNVHPLPKRAERTP